MLVRMLGHGGVQEAYTNTKVVGCGSCGGAIMPGLRYTLHLYPDKRSVNPLTNRYNMHYYALCALCAPFKPLEEEKQQPTSEIKPIGEQETEVVRAVRTNTPAPKGFKRVVLRSPYERKKEWMR